VQQGEVLVDLHQLVLQQELELQRLALQLSLVFPAGDMAKKRARNTMSLTSNLKRNTEHHAE
jgi:hypothetical protein